MPITITDLAQQLGVSHVTVSHALRGTGRVSAGLRERIRAAAEAAGYKPHAGARAIRERRHGAVALLHGTGYDRGRLPLGLLNGLHDGVEAQGWRLLVTRLRDDRPEPDQLPQLLNEWSADGLIVNFGERIPAALEAEIDRHHLPTIFLNARRDENAVAPDDLDAGRQAADHLIAHGHRRIAYADASICTDEWERAHSSIRLREEGAQEACARAGVRCDLIRRPTREVSFPGLLRQALTAQDRPTAIIGYGLSSLAPAIAVALEEGLRIPRDLSLVGFEYDPIALHPRIDSIQLPGRDLGRAAVELLAQRLAHDGGSVPARLIPGTLLREQSVAAPSR